MPEDNQPTQQELDELMREGDFYRIGAMFTNTLDTHTISAIEICQFIALAGKLADKGFDPYSLADLLRQNDVDI